MVGDSKGERLVAFSCFLVSFHPSEKGIWTFIVVMLPKTPA